MSGRFISEAEAHGGPCWQWLDVGNRVWSPDGRRKGTVVALIPPLHASGAPQVVGVRWDHGALEPEPLPSDGLALVGDPSL